MGPGTGHEGLSEVSGVCRNRKPAGAPGVGGSSGRAAGVRAGTTDGTSSAATRIRDSGFGIRESQVERPFDFAAAQPRATLREERGRAKCVWGTRWKLESWQSAVGSRQSPIACRPDSQPRPVPGASRGGLPTRDSLFATGALSLSYPKHWFRKAATPEGGSCATDSRLPTRCNPARFPGHQSIQCQSQWKRGSFEMGLARRYGGSDPFWFCSAGRNLSR